VTDSIHLLFQWLYKDKLLSRKLRDKLFLKDIFLIRFSLDKAACFIYLYNLSRLLVCLLIYHVYLKLLKEVLNLSKLQRFEADK